MAITASSSRPTLNSVRGAGEYATTFRWNLWMIKPPNCLGGMPANFNVLCESTDLPTKTVEKILIAIRGQKHYQPGVVTPNGTISLQFVETVRNDIHAWLLRWQESIWANNIGTGSPYSDLVTDIVITRLDNADNVICQYVLRYAFLEGYTLPRLDGTTSGPFNMTATFAYDDFYVVGNGANNLLADYSGTATK